MIYPGLKTWSETADISFTYHHSFKCAERGAAKVGRGQGVPLYEDGYVMDTNGCCNLCRDFSRGVIATAQFATHAGSLSCVFTAQTCLRHAGLLIAEIC